MTNNQLNWLDEQIIALPDGTSVIRDYDQQEDILELFFDDAPATATIELADGIYLRFNRRQYKPLSFSIMAFQARMRHQEFGQPLFSFERLAQLPDAERQAILQMLQRPPLIYVLHLYSFQPSPETQSIPVASVMEPLALPA